MGIVTSNNLLRRIETDQRLSLVRAIQEQTTSFPYFRRIDSPVEPMTVVDGKKTIMFGSNNYLGLANHPEVVEAAVKATEQFGAAMVGSRMYTGTTDLHLQLESELAEWHHAEDAILFTTGYQTSIGAICGLLGSGDSVVVDSAIHTSIRDACKLSGANVRTFEHNQLESLRSQLDWLAGRVGVTVVVVEGIYSMEGDAAPLAAIADLCDDAGVALMVDEAHSIGLLGAERTGLAELCGIADRVTIRMGTFSKALASTGGFIAGPRNLIDQLRISAHSFIFSMAAIPASVAAALAAVRITRSREGAALAEAALANAELLRSLLSERGVSAGGSSAATDIAGSPIVSVAPRRELGGLATWNCLLDAGIFTGLAAFPAVAADRAILRMSVMATHSPDMLLIAADAVASVVGQPN